MVAVWCMNNSVVQQKYEESNKINVVFSALLCSINLVSVPYYAKCKRVPVNIFLLLVLTNSLSYVVGGLAVEYNDKAEYLVI